MFLGLAKLLIRPNWIHEFPAQFILTVFVAYILQAAYLMRFFWTYFIRWCSPVLNKRLVCLVATCLLMACGLMNSARAEPRLPDFNEERLSLISSARSQVESMNEENIDAYLLRLDPESPIYDRYRIMMGQLFTVYDLDTRIEKINILSVEDDYAVVRMTMLKRKTGGRARFRDVSVDVLWVYRRSAAGWLLWSTLNLISEPLSLPEVGYSAQP